MKDSAPQECSSSTGFESGPLETRVPVLRKCSHSRRCRKREEPEVASDRFVVHSSRTDSTAGRARGLSLCRTKSQPLLVDRNVSDTHQGGCDLGSKQTQNREGYEHGFKVFGRDGREGNGYSCPIEEPRARCWRDGLSAPSTLTRGPQEPALLPTGPLPTPGAQEAEASRVVGEEAEAWASVPGQ